MKFCTIFFSSNQNYYISVYTKFNQSLFFFSNILSSYLRNNIIQQKCKFFNAQWSILHMPTPGPRLGYSIYRCAISFPIINYIRNNLFDASIHVKIVCQIVKNFNLEITFRSNHTRDDVY